jgi:Glycosyltransferase family 87
MELRSYFRPLVITAALLSFFLWVCGVIVTVRMAQQGRVDFRQLYAAGYMLRTGHRRQLYDFEVVEKFQNEVVSSAHGALPFNHLAYESLLFAPFSLLKYGTAYFAFLVLNLAILGAAFRLFRPYLGPLEQHGVFLPAATFVCFLPVALALAQGQDSMILLALLICATRALDCGMDFRSGVFVGLTLFKYQYGLPIALLFLIWRRWRFLLGFGAAAALALGISLSITGFAGFIDYLHSLAQMSSHFSPTYGAQYGIRPELMPNLRGLAYAFTQGSPHATLIATSVMSVVVLIGAASKPPSLPLALLAGILVSYHHLINDATMMILPAGLALSASLSSVSKKSTLLAALAVLVFIAPGPLLLGNARFYLLAIPMLAILAVWDGKYPVAADKLLQT